MFETLAKAIILSRGITFTDEACALAAETGAKGQNMVYNMPKGHSPGTFRPQELLIQGEDGYETCVSAIAPHSPASVVATVRHGRLELSAPGCEGIFSRLGPVSFVPSPSYYRRTTRAGTPLTRIVSACGVDELNVWPWHDCAISQTCTFCGVNKVDASQGHRAAPFTSRRRSGSALADWAAIRDHFLAELVEAVEIALQDECYAHHAHLILISGNLRNDELDAQADIYADMAACLTRHFPARFSEGIVAVTAPPSTVAGLERMRQAGVEISVLNLEAWSPEAFAQDCPGKHQIGRDRYLSMLRAGVDVFGWGKSWCNFVLGLDPVQVTLDGCLELAAMGIAPSANVLHLDEGARCRKTTPGPREIVHFFAALNDIYRRHDLAPYYCQRALRTSLSNEAYHGRLAPLGTTAPLDLVPDH